jgi:anti-sigma regulatory factor (Ser/Thr protein kinase)
LVLRCILVQVSRSFDADPASVREARSFVASAAAELDVDDLAWVLQQVVSELATNAVIHARTPFTLTLSGGPTRVRVEVHDTSARRIQKRDYDADATTGRGMQLVQAFARDWGVDTDPDGKTIWVELDEDAASVVADVDL